MKDLVLCILALSTLMVISCKKSHTATPQYACTCTYHVRLIDTAAIFRYSGISHDSAVVRCSSDSTALSLVVSVVGECILQ
jgi:hypothetical protein